jgi:hypothetical protein
MKGFGLLLYFPQAGGFLKGISAVYLLSQNVPSERASFFRTAVCPSTGYLTNVHLKCQSGNLYFNLI